MLDTSRRSIRLRRLAALAALALAAFAGAAQAAESPKSAPPAKPAWVEKSDKNAQVLIDLFASFGPEGASQFGVDGYDEKITDITPGFIERQTAATRLAIAELQKRLAAETDPAVRQDLEILIGSAEDGIEVAEVNQRLVVPYFDLHQLVF